MYPAHFFSLFPPFPRRDKVFVAMSFAPQFTHRWEKVIEPAFKRFTFKNKPLQAIRVDKRRISDSILTEILQGIRESRIIFADITSLGNLNGRVMRNENVFYEVGMAQATRLPAEVVLFRSDNDPLSFDVTNVRVNSYDPDGDPEAATDAVVYAILDGLREVDVTKNLAVQQAVDSLDFFSWRILCDAMQGPVQFPTISNMRQSLSNIHRIPAIARMLESGLLTNEYRDVSTLTAADLDVRADSMHRYRITPFGQAVMHGSFKKMGGQKLSHDQIKALETLGPEPNKGS